MREIELSLNQTQKIRLQRALENLQCLSSKSAANASVTVADTIPVNNEDNILKGHGTLELDGEVVATVCGVVDRVDKLVIVRSLRSRYKPDTGDIIVGRVVEVAQKRWRVEIHSNQDAVLMLSSVTLPDGIQRRRTAVDELNMRNIFVENDVISAEVRNSQHDGTWQLHARSDKYGKLERGQLITVPSYLVKRCKQHFHQLDQYGALLILGCNGYVWVGELTVAKDGMEVDDVNESEKTNANSIGEINLEENYTPLETRQNVCRIANAVRVLAVLGFNITVEVILELCDLSTSLNLDIHDMLGAEFCVAVAEKEVERRSIINKRKG
ncbi:exosome complex component RRP4 homolog [Chenopodium quinoa]|uniref:exosome complex component RRP4 homolog n=1 Tax=Chenopodium quinoa TaxID=63459 RepID=UPI000B77E3A8|nr:exosome complex component RRP4 homolog [Chenopodium quinoa]